MCHSGKNVNKLLINKQFYILIFRHRIFCCLSHDIYISGDSLKTNFQFANEAKLAEIQPYTSKYACSSRATAIEMMGIPIPGILERLGPELWQTGDIIFSFGAVKMLHCSFDLEPAQSFQWWCVYSVFETHVCFLYLQSMLVNHIQFGIMAELYSPWLVSLKARGINVFTLEVFVPSKRNETRALTAPPLCVWIIYIWSPCTNSNLIACCLQAPQ